MKIYRSGLKEIIIIHRAGKESSNDDALSCNHCGSVPAEGVCNSEVQVACANKCTTECNGNDDTLVL